MSRYRSLQLLLRVAPIASVLLLTISNAAEGQSVPTWTASFTYQNVKYPHTMVGTDPTLSGIHNTTIPVQLIPLILKFSDGTVFDPTLANSAGFAPSEKVVLSPLFLDTPFKAGSVNLGTTQYIDAFQRANFWNHIDSSHNFHVKLASPPWILYHQEFDIAASDGYTSTDNSGKKKGNIDWAFLSLLTDTMLMANSAAPNQLTIFLLYNVGIYNVGGKGPLHTAAGYHNWIQTIFGPATFIVSGFNDDKDVSTLSHELGEWLDDPFVDNKVPGWSGGQVSGCSKLLEVGDPLTGTRFTVTTSGLTYHLQDLTFLSWFARRNPSTSVNGWYSFRNNLSGPPAVCQ
jgi:hypothetical protein